MLSLGATMSQLRILRFCFALASVVATTNWALAQSVVPDVNTLRTHTGGYGANASVALQGYYATGDGGGGVLASGPTANSCQLPQITGTTASGSTLITFSGVTLPTGITLGMGITGPGIPTNDTVAAFDTVAPTITLTTMAGSGAGTGTITLSGDNGGTTIKDSSNNCFVRVISNGGPREWGAKGDASNDDTFSLQNWISAPQAHIGYIGSYKISGTLTCPPDTTIQGPANLVGSNAPLFEIKASASSFSGNSLIQAFDFCRLSGVALNANKVSSLDTLDVHGIRVTVDGFSALINGRHNVICETGESDGLQIKDTQMKGSSSDNIYLPSGCGNVRLVGDIVTTSGGAGVVFGGRDLALADGIVEQSAGIGLDLSNATYASVTGNFFDDNGKGGSGGAAIELNDSSTISICGNHISGNDEYPDPTKTAEIRFAGSNDGIDLCGNVYAAETQTGDVTLKPSYVYDAADSTVVTNSRLYESPAPQAVGVYTAGAAKILAPLQVPRLVSTYFSGFTLSNDSSVAKKVNIAVGEAADSTNTAVIRNASTCGVDLGASNGENGLDTGTVAGNTTYFYYAIAQAGGSNPGVASANPTCIASKNAARPSFVNTSGSDYAMFTHFYAPASSSYLYNVKSVAGIVPGDEIQSSTYIQDGTTVVSVGTRTINAVGGISTTAGTTTVTFTGTDNSQMAVGMPISDGVVFPGCSASANSAIPEGDTVATLVGTTGVTLTTAATANPTSDCIIVSGGNVVQITPATTSTPTGNTQRSIKFFTGVYRLLGALYTDSSGNVVGFTQDGDTFYLKISVTDIETGTSPVICAGSFGTSPQACPLSVPCGRTAATCSPGVKVEAIGRFVGGNNMLFLSSLDQSDQGPTSFPNAPGYTSKNPAPQVSFPFRLYTDTSGQVRVRASASSTSAYEVTDGWVFKRAQ